MLPVMGYVLWCVPLREPTSCKHTVQLPWQSTVWVLHLMEMCYGMACNLSRNCDMVYNSLMYWSVCHGWTTMHIDWLTCLQVARSYARLV